MDDDDALVREYREFVKAVNREPLSSGEHNRLALFDALTRQYRLERYPTPLILKQRLNMTQINIIVAILKGRVSRSRLPAPKKATGPPKRDTGYVILRVRHNPFRRAANS